MAVGDSASELSDKGCVGMEGVFQLSWHSHVPEGFWFGSHRISSLLSVDDVVLLDPSSQDLQHVLGWFAAECEVAGMRISTSKSE